MANVEFWWELVQTVLLVGFVFLLAGLTYNVASIRARIGPEARSTSLLKVGAAAPELRRDEARTKRPVVLAEIAGGGQVSVVAFLSPTCSACINDVPHLNALAETQPDVAFIAVIEVGDGFNFQADLSPAIRVVADTDRLLQAAFDVQLFPHISVVDFEGRLAAHAVSDVRGLEPLLRGLAGSVPANSRRLVVP